MFKTYTNEFDFKTGTSHSFLDDDDEHTSSSIELYCVTKYRKKLSIVHQYINTYNSPEAQQCFILYLVTSVLQLKGNNCD